MVQWQAHHRKDVPYRVQGMGTVVEELNYRGRHQEQDAQNAEVLRRVITAVGDRALGEGKEGEGVDDRDQLLILSQCIQNHYQSPHRRLHPLCLLLKNSDAHLSL